VLISPSHLKKWFYVKPKLIAHVGAHNAEESEAYSALGWSDVTWFEANPAMVTKLKEMAKLKGQEIIEGAVSNESGKFIDFYVASNSLSSSIFEFQDHSEIYPEISTTKKIKQKTITLDDYFAAREKPDLINLDIQGAELSALQGAKSTLRFTSWVYCEVNFRELYSGGANLVILERFLKKNNFKRVAIRRQFGEGWGDALYRNSKLTKFSMKSAIAEIYFRLRWDLFQFKYRIRLQAHSIKSGNFYSTKKI
jgi:FkbM family methyltransferase